MIEPLVSLFLIFLLTSSVAFYIATVIIFSGVSSMYYIGELFVSLAVAFFSALLEVVVAASEWLCWCFNYQHLRAAALLILELGSWISRWSWICFKIGVAILVRINEITNAQRLVRPILRLTLTCTQSGAVILMRVIQVLADRENWISAATFTLQSTTWATSSWRLRVLALFAALVGFRAWNSRSRRLSIRHVTVLAKAILPYLLTIGQVQSLDTTHSRAPDRLVLVLIIDIAIGSGLYMFGQERPDFVTVATLVTGVAAYFVSKDTGLEKCVQLSTQTPLRRRILRGVEQFRYVAGQSIRQDEAEQRRFQETSTTSLEPICLDTSSEIQAQLCMVCGDDKQSSEFPKYSTTRCRHFPNICSQDLKSWISSQLTDNAWNRIKCPEPSCSEFFQYEDMKANASELSFARYEAFQLRSVLSKIHDFRWCLSPTCSSGQIHPHNSRNPIFTCNECSFKACTIHNIKWHQGETCKQYDYRVSGKKAKHEEKATRKKIMETTKSCPKCKANIEKRDGCDHMICTSCKMEFCWLCLVDYESVRRAGNLAHKRSCRHHTNNL